MTPTPSDVLETHVVQEEGERADVWAARVFAGVGSRAAARKRIRAGRILFDGESIETSRFVRSGQRAQLLIDPTVPPCDLVVDVLFSDAWCAVVHKPAGVLTNGNRHRTLENALPNVLPVVDAPDALVRPRPAHRLDYETAGPVAIGRTHQALVAWSKAFEERQVRKRYEAVVVGRLEEPCTVELELDGRSAVSEITPLYAFRSLKTGWCTRVALVPVTGRMHQLRRHLQHLGHSVLGDRRYPVGPVFDGKGLFLACTGLDLPHPVTDERVVAQSAVPLKFRSFEEREIRRWERWHGEGSS